MEDSGRAQSLLVQIESVGLKDVRELPFSLLGRPGNKSTRLVANSGDTSSMDGAHRWFDYEFSEPVFLCEVLISMEKYSSHHNFEFKWESYEGENWHKDIYRENETTYRLKVNQLIKSVSFKPPKTFFTNPKINSVSLKGLMSDEIGDFLNIASHLDMLKREIVADSVAAIFKADEARAHTASLKEERDRVADSLVGAKSELSVTNGEIGRLTGERNSLIADVSARQINLSDLEEKEKKQAEAIAERISERVSLATKISEHQQELRSLRDDINMFPTEISGFVLQASNNTTLYWRLSVVPVALLVVMSALLVFNAANLTTVFDENSNARIFSILITRLPYVIVATAIIGVAYKLAVLLIGEIFRINQQRLNLSKVSIIATDVSRASAEGLDDLTNEDIYHLRTGLKMEILRDHLKQYISADLPEKLQKKPFRPRDSIPKEEEAKAE